MAIRHYVALAIVISLIYMGQVTTSTEEGPEGGFGIFGLIPYLVEGK